MVLTLRAAVEAAEEAGEGSLGEAMAAARGALLGARGNSGVILSQWLRGLAEGCEGAAVVDGVRLRAGLERAASVAVTAMSEPREGTMLSVAGALVREADAPAGSAAVVLAEAVERAEAAVARTPEQLPLLAEAGVVDAGGARAGGAAGGVPVRAAGRGAAGAGGGERGDRSGLAGGGDGAERLRFLHGVHGGGGGAGGGAAAG